MKTKSILILEDNPIVLKHLREALSLVAKTRRINLRIIDFPTLWQAREYLNAHPAEIFDVILLDRNDAMGESFHALDLERLGHEKIISISSVPRNNEDARALGVRRAVLKDYAEIGDFVRQVADEVSLLIR